MARQLVKSYSELSKFKTFEERFEYLKTESKVGEDTFGYDRYLNQILYTSKEWRNFRNEIIARDNGHDMGLEDTKYEIPGMAVVHHINPVTKEDILNRDPAVFDPENAITLWDKTHKAVHYGKLDTVPKEPPERKKNDTCPWRK